MATEVPETDEAAPSVEHSPAGSEYAQWAIVAARAAEDKLATNTIVVDVAEVIAITDVFVITAGANPRQVRAIANNIEEEVVKAGGPRPVRSEGLDTYEWVLIDFGGFICHIFDEAHRAYYELERLWADRPSIDWA
ncbi:MAG: ribosome silencing factor [Acidimicrobiales bacterium]